MFLLNSCLGLFSAAPSRGRPFSRSYGAILPSSLAVLRPPALGSSPCPPVSVFGTGTLQTIAAFLGARSMCFATLFRYASDGRLIAGRDFPLRRLSSLHRFFLSRLTLCQRVPASSVIRQYRNLYLLSIGYAFRPRLRPRLTQGRSALPWKPWTFGRKDSHLPLATHSGILPSRHSTAPLGTASSCRQCSPTAHAFAWTPGFGGMF